MKELLAFAVLFGGFIAIGFAMDAAMPFVISPLQVFP
jgi:hypothetical protein